MKPISEHHRVEAYRNAPENVRGLYVNETLTEKLDILHTSFKIPVTFREFSTVIGDAILGFYRLSEVPMILQEKFGVTQETSKSIVLQLSSLLEPILKPADSEKLSQKTELQKLAEQFAEKSRRVQQVEPEVAKETVSEVSPAQPTPASELEKVQPLRTMQGDINRIHGYGAYNEMLEKEGNVHTSNQDTTLKK